MASAAINRTFGLFVNSTFTDFIAEREALQSVVFPKVEAYSEARGRSEPARSRGEACMPRPAPSMFGNARRRRRGLVCNSYHDGTC